MIRTLVPVKVAPPPPVRVQATLEEIQEHVSVFEAIDCWYALLETQE